MHDISLDARRPWRSLATLLKPQRWRLALAALVFVALDSPIWLLPVVVSGVVDVAVDGGPVHRLWFWAVVGAVVLVQNYPMRLWFTSLYATVTRRLGVDLRGALTWHLHGLSHGFHSRASAAVIQSKIVRDVENVEIMMQQAGPAAWSALLVLVGALVVTALTVPIFIAVFALTLPLAAVMRAAMMRRSARRNAAFRHEVEQLSSQVGEMAMLMPLTRAHGLESVAERRVAARSENVMRAGLSLDMLNGGFGALTWVVLQLVGLAGIILAGAATIYGWFPITPGQVVLVATYFTILINAIASLLSLLPILTRGGESLASIGEVLSDDDLEENVGKPAVDDVSGAISVRAVSYTYPQTTGSPVGPAVRHVTLEIAAGETVAFVGPSGSGKSTLLNLVLGFLRPSAGSIAFDAHDMQAIDMRTLRRHVSVVQQQPALFAGSIAQNVAYGMDDVDDEVVREALREAGALEFVDRQPDGIHTLVGERGARLSGGQLQRIAIARALVRDPRILLLDEATSALDVESERVVQDALAVLRGTRTTLVVAHRLSTVRTADRIVVLRNGRIVEQGSHEVLLAAGGVYAEMVRLQRD